MTEFEIKSVELLERIAATLVRIEDHTGWVRNHQQRVDSNMREAMNKTMARPQMPTLG